MVTNGSDFFDCKFRVLRAFVVKSVFQIKLILKNFNPSGKFTQSRYALC